MNQPSFFLSQPGRQGAFFPTSYFYLEGDFLAERGIFFIVIGPVFLDFAWVRGRQETWLVHCNLTFIGGPFPQT